NFTVPVTVAAVAGSIGVAAGPAGFAAGCSSAVSFLPQPARSASTSSGVSPRIRILVFISLPLFLKLRIPAQAGCPAGTFQQPRRVIAIPQNRRTRISPPRAAPAGRLARARQKPHAAAPPP